MILLDMNQITIGSIMAESKGNPIYDENLIRHLILNNILSIKSKFSDTYGKIVICYDSPLSWRKLKYNFYKQNRKKIRDKSNFDWKKLYNLLNTIKDELQMYFPYTVIEMTGVEADDIISVLSRNYNEKNLIVSSDEDFFQLQKHENISQYSLYHKKIVVCPSPEDYLYEHVIRGDSSDGIPNVFSDDDTFIDESKRQKRISKKQMDLWKSGRILNGYSISSDANVIKNINRNRELIDLSMIPKEYEDKIKDAYDNYQSKDKSKILEYLMSKKMKNLIDHLSEF